MKRSSGTSPPESIRLDLDTGLIIDLSSPNSHSLPSEAGEGRDPSRDGLIPSPASLGREWLLGNPIPDQGNRITLQPRVGLALLTALLIAGLSSVPCFALNPHPISPLDQNPPIDSAGGMQTLSLGGSTAADVSRALGRAPDTVYKEDQMFPVIEDDLYSDNDGSSAAMVFVFQNNMLAGLQYRTRDNQFVDMTYLIPNKGDGTVNQFLQGGISPYYFQPRFYSVPMGN